LGILQDMRSRGGTQVDLFVTDGHEGLLGRLASSLPRPLANAAWSTSNAIF
jgi:transposase-like protein